MTPPPPSPDIVDRRDEVARALAQRDDDPTLVDLIDRLLAGGVVIQGDLTLSVAGVDLLYVGLRLIVASPDDVPHAP